MWGNSKRVRAWDGDTKDKSDAKIPSGAEMRQERVSSYWPLPMVGITFDPNSTPRSPFTSWLEAGVYSCYHQRTYTIVYMILHEQPHAHDEYSMLAKSNDQMRKRCRWRRRSLLPLVRYSRNLRVITMMNSYLCTRTRSCRSVGVLVQT